MSKEPNDDAAFLAEYAKVFGQERTLELTTSMTLFLAARCKLFRAEIKRLGGDVNELIKEHEQCPGTSPPI